MDVRPSPVSLTAPNPARFARAALRFLRLGSSIGASPSPYSSDELRIVVMEN